MSPPAGRPAQQVHLPGIDAPRFLPPDVLGATVGPAETRGGASDGDLYLLGRRARLGDALHELGGLGLGGVGECAGVVADGRAFHYLSAPWMVRASRLALSDTAASVAPVPPLAMSKVTVRPVAAADEGRAFEQHIMDSGLAGVLRDDESDHCLVHNCCLRGLRLRKLALAALHGILPSCRKSVPSVRKEEDGKSSRAPPGNVAERADPQ